MSQDVTSALTDAQAKAVAALPSDERERLSLVLFPREHTKSVSLLGKHRQVRPLPVKWARILHRTLQPIKESLVNSMSSKEVTDFDEQLISALIGVTANLAEFYDWKDVLAAVQEESILLSEMQSLVAVQAAVQGEHDFLLLPLSMLWRVMQLVEIRSRNLSLIFNGQASLTPGGEILSTS